MVESILKAFDLFKMEMEEEKVTKLERKKKIIFPEDDDVSEFQGSTSSLFCRPNSFNSVLSQRSSFSEPLYEYNFFQVIFGSNRSIIILQRDTNIIQSVECRTLFAEKKFRDSVAEELSGKIFTGARERLTPTSIYIKDSQVSLESFLYSIRNIYNDKTSNPSDTTIYYRISEKFIQDDLSYQSTGIFGSSGSDK